MLLYPELPPAEGRARIRRAMGASDPPRLQQVEEVAPDPEVLEELARRLRRLSGRRRRIVERPDSA